MDANPQGSSGHKSLVVFVHGFNSGPECWNVLTGLMEKDAAMVAAFDWKCFSYESKVGSGLFNLKFRLPDYKDITASFDQYLRKYLTADYDQFLLVGHSQGGLIIQSWLAKVLVDAAAIRLQNLREVVFVCTPTLGSEIGSSLRKAVFSVIHDPQESHLRVLDDAVATTRRMVEERIVQTSLRDQNHWPVPVLSIWGQDDNVVSAVSAQASFDNVLTVSGDHSSVLHPKDRDDDRYTVLTGALLQPVGHRHIFEVDQYETTIQVEPLTQQSYAARRGAVVETRQADNFARVIRAIRFAEGNTCTDLYRFNYQTGPAGFLTGSFDEVGRSLGAEAPPNEAPGDMKERWDKGENDVIYDFRPVAGRTYRYEVDVWKGFDAGNRDVHFHFEGNCRVKQYVFTVDLSAYLAAGWSVSQPPRLYVDPAGTPEHSIHERRLPANEVAATEANLQTGVWRWVIWGFTQGIVDAVWDVTERAAK